MGKLAPQHHRSAASHIRRPRTPCVRTGGRVELPGHLLPGAVQQASGGGCSYPDRGMPHVAVSLAGGSSTLLITCTTDCPGREQGEGQGRESPRGAWQGVVPVAERLACSRAARGYVVMRYQGSKFGRQSASSQVGPPPPPRCAVCAPGCSTCNTLREEPTLDMSRRVPATSGPKPGNAGYASPDSCTAWQYTHRQKRCSHSGSHIRRCWQAHTLATVPRTHSPR